jgi:hypothetical protein
MIDCKMNESAIHPVILFFAEDPGAVNFILPIVSKFNTGNFSNIVLSNGAATNLLDMAGLQTKVISHCTNPDEILGKLDPSLFITGTSENKQSPGLILIEACRKRSIPSIGLVDAYMNSKFRFSGTGNNPLEYAPEFLFLPDIVTKAKYVRLGFPPEKAFAFGHPNNDRVRAELKILQTKDYDQMRHKLFPSADVTSKIIVFAAELSEGIDENYFSNSSGYKLKGRGSKKRTNIAIEEFLDAVSRLDNLHIVLRLHPKNTIEEFKDYLNEFNQISIDESPHEIVYYSDCVVGLTSMLIVEAAIMEKPTFSILVDEREKEWLPTFRSGVTAYATGHNELLIKLPKFINSVAEVDHKAIQELFRLNCIEHIHSQILDIMER